ncbi:Molybdate/tungstate import ATP-binding protein WtpC [Candidatus Norongarragalina meridionalis]|nr:Molybdate/tungstate import ATP-binding protein WtpC [Candidatus Norongarragalina meridionalis]
MNYEISIDDVRFSYDDREVLSGASFRLGRGIAAVYGDNGCGKTTLGKIMAGILKPTAGAVRVPSSTTYVFQNPNHQLFEETVREEVGLGAVSTAAAKRALESMLLDPRRDCATLSYGERKRLAFCCALASEPALLIADEPFASQDLFGRQAIAKALRRVPSVILLTHNPVSFAAKNMRLHRGKIIGGCGIARKSERT